MKILNAERDDYGYEMIIYDLIEGPLNNEENNYT